MQKSGFQNNYGRQWTFMAIIALLLSLSIQCGKKEQKKPENAAPTDNMEAFLLKKYPTATDIFWDSLDNGFMANFFEREQDKKAFFDPQGRFEYTTTPIEPEALPTAINQFLSKKYPKATIAVAQIIEDARAKAFLVEIENFTDYISLEFDDEGKLRQENKHPLSNEELQRQEEEGVDNQ